MARPQSFAGRTEWGCAQKDPAPGLVSLLTDRTRCESSLDSEGTGSKSPGSMHNTGCLGLVHWNDPEGWNGEGGGRRVQDGEHMYT